MRAWSKIRENANINTFEQYYNSLALNGLETNVQYVKITVDALGEKIVRL